MYDLTRRWVNLGGNVMDVANMIVPSNASDEPLVVNLSRELLTAYFLRQMDSLNYPDVIEYTLLSIKSSKNLSKEIEAFLERSLEVQFSRPEEMKEGFFYLFLDKNLNEMRYAVMRGKKCFTGTIVDPEYDHFKQKLKRTGTLVLKEVNFLIEKVIQKRRHLKAGVEVMDVLCCRNFSHFLTLDLKTQASVVKLLMAQLSQFGNLSVQDSHDYDFFVAAPSSTAEMDERIFNLTHLREHHQSRKLMTYDAELFLNIDLYQEHIAMEEFKKEE